MAVTMRYRGYYFKIKVNASAFEEAYSKYSSLTASDEKKDPESQVVKPETVNYVDLTRIAELKTLKSNDYDLLRLIHLCEELNIVFSQRCYFSTIMLVRAIIDHLPPIFKKNSFADVANQHGSSSFKNSMKKLDTSSRDIADSQLHTHIRRKEILPNSTQVNFSNDLDVLLAEVCRMLKN